MSIPIEAVRPEIVAHLAPRVFDVRGEPRQHRLERRGLGEVGVRVPLRREERFLQRLRDPAIALVYVAPDRDDVHDRKNAGAAEVLAFDGGKVLEQPDDGAAAG